MKSICFLFLVSATLALGAMSWAQCVEDAFDLGACDTLHVEPYSPDLVFSGPGHLVRVPILVTHDLGGPRDSIPGFTVPLGYSHSNPSSYCSLSEYWNTTTTLWSAPDFSNRSIYRHITDGSDTLYHNRMAELAADYSGRDWDFIVLSLESDSIWCYWDPWPDPDTIDSALVPAHFWLAMTAIDVGDQRWWEGSRTLLATMTFKLEDTMTICVDSCFWPPCNTLYFCRYDGQIYVPRPMTPSCFSVSRALGDVKADGVIDLADLVYLLNYLFKNGLAPVPLWTGDTNGDDLVELADVVYLLNYLFKGGPPPGC